MNSPKDKMKTKKCICDDQYKALGFGEARTWNCPQHGPITVDRRIPGPQFFPIPQPPLQPQPLPVPWPNPTIIWQSDQNREPANSVSRDRVLVNSRVS
jgi:hypothetical protein